MFKFITRTIFFIMMIGVVVPTIAQKKLSYKVKNDVIYKDKKVPVGKVTGKAGLGGTDLSITDMEGNTVLTITQGEALFNNPFIDDLRWYEMKFEDSGKSFKVNHQGNCGIKCVLKFGLAKKGIVLSNGYIENQDELIKTLDISDDLTAKIAAAKKKHEEMVTSLEKNKILRATDKAVLLVKQKESTEADTKRTVFHIVQDNQVVGKLIKRVVTGTSSVNVYYTVYEKIYDSNEFIPASKVTSTFSGQLTYKTVVDGKTHKLKVTDTHKAEKSLANALVKQKYI